MSEMPAGALGKKCPRLMLVFTRGISLGVWDRVGMLEREVELYKRLRPHLGGISFLTYGGESELAYAEHLEGIDIVPNIGRRSPTKFSILAPFLLRREFKKADIIKTNQLDGAWTAIITKILYRKKAIVRCGYLWSEFQQNISGPGRHSRLALFMEKMCLRLADVCVVATERDARIIRERHGVKPAKIRVVPNYVDLDVFKPMPEVPKEEGLVCFVGRLAPQKNVEMLFDACSRIDGIRLLVIGDGPLRDQLTDMAARLRLDVEFHRSIANSELPRFLNRANAFVLPSHYEGCPKTLLEAMACELPVVGTDVEGIRDIVRDGENGLLCEKSTEGILKAVQWVFHDEALSAQLAKKAREYILQRHSLERILEMETAIIHECLPQKEPGAS
jgi:glycosyltransferase involved in cell wall biosynthesis